MDFYHCERMDELAAEIGVSDWHATPADRDCERRGGTVRCGHCGGLATKNPTANAYVCHACGAVRTRWGWKRL